MSKYTDELVEKEGIAESRVYDIELAFDRLHAALCRLDNHNLTQFKKKTLTERFNEYVESGECLRNLYLD